MEKAMIVKEEFRFNYPDLNDFELATDYFDISSPDELTTFKRSISVKIPTTSEGFTEEYRYAPQDIIHQQLTVLRGVSFIALFLWVLSSSL